MPVRNRTELDLGIVTIAEALASAGYVSGHVGKWHLGGSGFLPSDQGFEWAVAGDASGGSSSDVSVIGIDLYPTILTMAGVAPPDDHPLDGVSLAPLLRGEAQLSERPLFWHFPAHLEADTSVSGPWRTTPPAAVRVDDDKLVTFFEDGRGELYDLAEDIGETRDLADEMPARAGRLRSILEQWWRDTDAWLPTEANPLYDPDHAASPGSPRSP